MDGFWTANFYHNHATQPKQEHKTIFFSCSCFGPLENLTYGICDDGTYYCEHTASNDFDESDLQCEIQYLQKQEMLKILEQEIKLCKTYHKTQFLPRLQEIQQEIQAK